MLQLGGGEVLSREEQLVCFLVGQQIWGSLIWMNNFKKIDFDEDTAILHSFDELVFW